MNESPHKQEIEEHMQQLSEKIKMLEMALQYCLEHGMDRKAYVLIEAAQKKLKETS